MLLTRQCIAQPALDELRHRALMRQYVCACAVCLRANDKL
jgi:hypothetical protein